jgi:hypothetical protein
MRQSGLFGFDMADEAENHSAFGLKFTERGLNFRCGQICLTGQNYEDISDLEN